LGEIECKTVDAILFIVYNHRSYHWLFSLNVIVTFVPPAVPSSSTLSMISMLSSLSFKILSNSSLDLINPIPLDSCVDSYNDLYCLDNSRPMPSSSRPHSTDPLFSFTVMTTFPPLSFGTNPCQIA